MRRQNVVRRIATKLYEYYLHICNINNYQCEITVVLMGLENKNVNICNIICICIKLYIRVYEVNFSQWNGV